VIDVVTEVVLDKKKTWYKA